MAVRESLQGIVNQLSGSGVLYFRENSILPRRVRTNFSSELSSRGNVIVINGAGPQESYDVVPSPNNPDNPEATIETVQIKLNRWRHSGFFMTDEEASAIEEGHESKQAQRCTEKLVSDVNIDILGLYKDIPYWVGDATKSVAEDHTGADLIKANMVLNLHSVPHSNRFGVVNSYTEAQLLSIPAFYNIAATGVDVLHDAVIGKKFGAEWYAQNEVIDHITTVSGDWLIKNGTSSIAAGASITKITGGSGVPIIGDLFTVASSSQQFVVTDYDSDQKIMSFYPPSATEISEDEKITFVGSHTANLVYHEDALAFASRGLNDVRSGSESSRTISDPVSNIALRVEAIRQSKQILWDHDILYGVKCVNREGAVRLISKIGG